MVGPGSRSEKRIHALDHEIIHPVLNLHNRIGNDSISNLYGLSIIMGKHIPTNIQVIALGGIWGKIHIIKQMTRNFRPEKFMLRALISPTIDTLNSINIDEMDNPQLKVCNKLLNDIYSAWLWIYTNEQ